MAIRTKEEDHFSVELTPMIDMVFLLIVFFLVSTTFQQMEREMQVSVPKADTGESRDKERDPVVVNVLEDGRVVVRGTAMNLAQLESLLARAVAADGEAKALIRADGGLSFEVVVQVADACRKAEARVSFATVSSGEARVRKDR